MYYVTEIDSCIPYTLYKFSHFTGFVKDGDEPIAGNAVLFVGGVPEGCNVASEESVK